MSKYLTDKWKNGELKEGFYYVHRVIKDIPYGAPDIDDNAIAYFDGKDFDRLATSNIKEVLGRVLDYSEYTALKRKAKF